MTEKKLCDMYTLGIDDQPQVTFTRVFEDSIETSTTLTMDTVYQHRIQIT